MTPENKVSVLFLLEIETVTTKIVYSKSLKKICSQFLSTMNVLKMTISVFPLLFFSDLSFKAENEKRQAVETPPPETPPPETQPPETRPPETPPPETSPPETPPPETPPPETPPPETPPPETPPPETPPPEGKLQWCLFFYQYMFPSGIQYFRIKPNDNWKLQH